MRAGVVTGAVLKLVSDRPTPTPLQLRVRSQSACRRIFTSFSGGGCHVQTPEAVSRCRRLGCENVTTKATTDQVTPALALGPFILSTGVRCSTNLHVISLSPVMSVPQSPLLIRTLLLYRPGQALRWRNTPKSPAKRERKRVND